MAINVSDNNPRINYTATSGQTVFTVPFEFFASTDLTVYVGGSVLATSAYTVTGGSGSTGSITTDSGQTAGAEIAIVRDVPLERTTDLTSSYSASSLNDQLDRIVTQVADLDDRVSRSISLNDYEVGVSLDLPAKASRLGKTVQFNSTTGALEVGPSGNELTSIASIASEITALDGIKANITTVAGAISDVNSVGSNISSVTSVASSISNVNTVNTNIANVNSVATSIADVNDVADSIDQVELVGGSISNVDIVGPAIANVNTVAGDISNINTVAAISANVTTVAGITAAISTVNSNATNINLAATNIDDVNDVANVITKVTTVADNIANVNTVAPSVSYLSTVANNISNINTLAPISADITTVAGVASSIANAAANAAAAEAAKVAAELAADNFDDTYLGAKSSDPSVDNDGDSLNAGDLYFSTTDNNLKVYSGSAWQDAAIDSSSFVQTTGDTMTGNLSIGSILQSNRTLFMGSAYYSYFDIITSLNTTLLTSGSAISDTTLKLRVADGGTETTILDISKTGIDVTGTVTADGLTVDGDGLFDSDTAKITVKSFQPKLILDDDSAVGAGSDKLILQSVSGQSAGDYEFVINNDQTSSTDQTAIKISGNGDISFYEDTGTTAKLFWDASAEKLRFGGGTTDDFAGSVGLSGQVFTVEGYINNSLVINAKPNASNEGVILQYNGNDGLILNNAGNVGIGTTSPAFNTGSGIEIERAGEATLRLQDTTNTANGEVRSGNAGLTFYAGAYGTSGAPFIWNAGGTERLRIDSSGNVGIGTSSPDDKLHVYSSSSLDHIKVDGPAGINRNINFATAGSTRWNIYANNSVESGSNAGSNLSFARYTDAGAFISTAMLIERSSGNVGIGTSSPSAGAVGGKVIHVQNSGATASVRVDRSDASTAGTLSITSGNTSLGVYGTGAKPMLFYTNSTERMRIDSSGNVGIGTSSPSYALSVAKTTTGTHAIDAVNNTTGAGSTRLILRNPNSDTNGNGFQIINNANDGAVNLLNYKNTSLAFWTNATERLTITSSGNVNIGLNTGIPTGGTSLTGYNTGPILSIGATDTSLTNGEIAGSITFITSDTSYTGTYSDGITGEIASVAETLVGGGYGLAFYTGVTTGSNRAERVRIDYSGNVGIGTNSPAQALHVNAGTTNEVARFESTDGTAYLSIMDSATSNSLQGIGSAANDLTFYSNAAERMRIDSSGNLLVSKTAANIGTVGHQFLSDGQGDYAAHTSNGTRALLLNRKTSDGEILDFRKDGTTVGSIGNNGGDVYIGTGVSGLLFLDGDPSITPHNTSANTANDSAIDIGRSSRRFKDLYLSGGVYLGGTGAANKLDDYEEGTWTPVDGSGAGLTLSNVVANYTKIGRQVFVQCELQYPTTSDTSDMDISGLPFAARDTFRFAGVMAYTTSALAGSAQIVNGTTTSIKLRQNGSSTVLHNDELSGVICRFTMVYHTNA